MILKNAMIVAALGGALSTACVGDDADPVNDAEFLRMKSEGGQIALELAVQTLKSCKPEAPEVILVGVAHIAESSFYEDINEVLSNADLVLYESVLPAGARRPSGDTKEERVASTEASMKFVATLLAWTKQSEGQPPQTLQELGVVVRDRDARMAQWLSEASIDAWGNALVYSPATESEPWKLTSWGSDGAQGGQAEAEDLELTDNPNIQPPSTSGDHGIQGQLAKALNLEFQLEALPYEEASWRCSDLSFDQLARNARARGFELDGLADTLAGSSIPAKFAKTILAAIPMLDAMSGGRVSDALKVMMIEILSDETMIEAGMSYLGDGFQEVIIGDRNQAVMDDLSDIIDNEPDIKSVAILYGAGHMQDFVERLDRRFCYQLSETQWFVAMMVDLNRSSLSRIEMAQLRLAMKRMLERTKSEMERERAPEADPAQQR